MASESGKKCVQRKEMPVQLGPVRTKRSFLEKSTFFRARMCTSIHLSKLSDQPAPQDQVGVDVLKPCVQYILLKCGNVQMSAPAAHCKKQATVLYLDTNPRSTVLQPRGFSHGRKSEMM